MEVWVLIRQPLPLDLGPDHEGVHRASNPLLFLLPLCVTTAPVVAEVVVLDPIPDKRVNAATLTTHQAGVVVGVVPPG